MDPITLAAQKFSAEFELFWNPPPGHEVDGPRVLRLVSSGSERKDMIKALRLMEWQPDNRRPFVVVDDKFTDEAAIIAAIANALDRDFASLRKGLAEDRIVLAALAPMAPPITMRALMNRLRDAVQSVCAVLDGLVLVLAPAKVADGAAYATVVRQLAPLSDGERLRLAVVDDEALRDMLPASASFLVDQAALFAFLRGLGAPSEGPASDKPALSPTQKAQLEKELGRRIPAEATAQSLRVLLLDAGRAMSDNQPKLAARKFRAARMLCHLSGLLDEEVGCSIAVGTAAFANRDMKGALAAYRQGGKLATEHGLRTLAVQAEIGVAATYFSMTEYAIARDSYRTIANDMEVPAALRIEGWRMSAECSRALKDHGAAVGDMEAAIALAEALEAPEREATAYELIGDSLLDIYKTTGQQQRLRGLSERLSRTRGQPATSDEVPA